MRHLPCVIHETPLALHAVLRLFAENGWDTARDVGLHIRFGKLMVKAARGNVPFERIESDLVARVKSIKAEIAKDKTRKWLVAHDFFGCMERCNTPQFKAVYIKLQKELFSGADNAIDLETATLRGSSEVVAHFKPFYNLLILAQMSRIYRTGASSFFGASICTFQKSFHSAGKDTFCEMTEF